MSEKLKDMYTEQVLQEMAIKFKEIYNKFDSEKFLQLLQKDWKNLELKQRFTRLAESFYITCNLPFVEVTHILKKINEQCQGFKYMFLPEIVEIYGQDHIKESLETLEVLTTGSSAEFAIRTFLKLDFNITFNQMKKWAVSPNEHHRRLASEGIRTKLPWGKKVDILYEYPLEIIKILELLNKDDSLYVRKSVANNLNDLSKDFPDLIIETVKKWDMNNEKTAWIIKQGCRTLIKEGNSKLLKLLNYNTKDIKIIKSSLKTNKNSVKLNEESIFDYEIILNSKNETKVRLALEFNFIRLNNKISKKIFFLKDTKIKDEKVLKGSKKYTWKDMTTRKHYSGSHKIKLILNDIILDEIEIDFKG